jgi:hypothetical protein
MTGPRAYHFCPWQLKQDGSPLVPPWRVVPWHELQFWRGSLAPEAWGTPPFRLVWPSGALASFVEESEQARMEREKAIRKPMARVLDLFMHIPLDSQEDLLNR